MVRLGEWSVRARYSRPRSPGGVSHHGDGGAAVGPVAVAVQVAAQGCVQSAPPVGEWLRHRARAGPRGSRAPRRPPPAGPPERPVADALHAFQPAVPRPRRHLVRFQGADDAGCLPERLDLEGGSAPALQPEGDLVERSDGIHLSIFACSGRCSGTVGGRFWIIPRVGPIVLESSSEKRKGQRLKASA